MQAGPTCNYSGAPRPRAAKIVSLTGGNRVTGTMRRAIMIAILSLVATPASAELRIPCLWNPFGGCSFSFVSPEYAAKPVQPLDPQAALAAINAFRAENGRKPLVLDERLSRAAAMQSEAQAGRSWIGHSGSDGSTPKARAAARRLSCEDRLRECRLRAEILRRRAQLLEAKLRASDQPAASECDRSRSCDGQD